jgi:hypothetical protein
MTMPPERRATRTSTTQQLQHSMRPHQHMPDQCWVVPFCNGAARRINQAPLP